MLESWVVELFGDVKSGSKVRPTLEAKGPIWEGGKLYRLEAVKDVHIFDLTWTLPPLRHAYVKKPEDYLAHLLGHGEKSHPFLLFIYKVYLCMHLCKLHIDECCLYHSLF